MRKTLLLTLALLVALSSSFLPRAGAQQSSKVSVVHGIPGATVDVYVNGALTLEDFAPKSVAGPLDLPAGNYAIRVFAANADPQTATPVIDVPSAAVPGGANVSLVAHLDANGTPKLSPFVNDVATIAAGQGKVTIRHTAKVPAVDIVLNGAPVSGLTNLANGGQGSVTLPVGSYATGIAATGTTAVLVPAPVTVAEGTNTIVYAIGALDANTVDLVVQTIGGLHTAPARVDTGNSGLAADEPVGIGRLTLFVLAGGLLLLSGGAFATRRLLPVTR